MFNKESSLSCYILEINALTAKPTVNFLLRASNVTGTGRFNPKKIETNF
jgi:hypothetical protein